MKCSVYIGTSLDGFIARPDGTLDFLDVAQVDKVEYGYKAFYASLDAIVIGRGTYDFVCALPDWPYAGKRVIVMTHRPVPPRGGEELVSTTPRELAARLERDGANRVYIDGGVVIRQFLDADLIDDITISVMPVLIGAGIPLFGGPSAKLALVGTQSWPTGVVQLRYARARD
jgi:dihydrofolate reductase